MALEGSEQSGDMKVKLEVLFADDKNPQQFVTEETSREFDLRIERAVKNGILKFLNDKGEYIYIILSKVKYFSVKTVVVPEKKTEKKKEEKPK